MSSLDTVAKLRRAFLRLVGTESDDPALTDLGEAANEVTNYFLTRGVWAAQRNLLKVGYQGWKKRSSAITSWTGSDDTDGGRYTTLPTDFLRAYGSHRHSCLVEADGDPWGQQILQEQANQRGDGFYFEGVDQLWLTRDASPPSTLYLWYHYRHPEIDGDLDDADIDFPVEARPMIPAEAAFFAMEEAWVPGGQDMELRISRARNAAREAARGLGRSSKQPRTFRRVRRAGNHW